jgi:hypothetical protein
MAAKLGTADVSFRLGAGEVAAVYLGSQEVWTAGVTLYYLDANSEDWADLDNWFSDAGYEEPAGRLPAPQDSVILGGVVSENTGAEPTVVNLETIATLAIDITVTGLAAFVNASAYNGTLAGNALFTETSYNDGEGVIVGNATFTGTARNLGTVTGTATFNDSACNAGGTAGTFVPATPPSCPE